MLPQKFSAAATCSFPEEPDGEFAAPPQPATSKPSAATSAGNTPKGNLAMKLLQRTVGENKAPAARQKDSIGIGLSLVLFAAATSTRISPALDEFRAPPVSMAGALAVYAGMTR